MSDSSYIEFDLSGLIDMHVHTAPDTRPRLYDDIDAVSSAEAAGLAAVLIKSHVTLTADRAVIAEKAVGGRIRVFGGLVLNEFVGGLNPASVEMALSMGSKQIWMPTLSAERNTQKQGEFGGICIFTENGEICSEVHIILDLIREADAILGTGHVSLEETVALTHLALKKGLRKILITHPEARLTRMDPQIQKELAQEGVYFERCYVNTTPIMNSTVSVAEIARHIRFVGVESTVLSTDLGQLESPPPIEGMRTFLVQLAREGFAMKEIRHMAGENPASLLNL